MREQSIVPASIDRDIRCQFLITVLFRPGRLSRNDQGGKPREAKLLPQGWHAATRTWIVDRFLYVRPSRLVGRKKLGFAPRVVLLNLAFSFPFDLHFI
jgi:hypothetical protein